jgi:uncharacterized protein (TIGR02145 family)
MIVYNTVSVGTGAAALSPGLYVNNGNTWSPIAIQGQVQFITQPGTKWAGVNGEKEVSFTVAIANPQSPAYTWYQLDANGTPSEVPGANTATLTIPADNYSEGGLYTYFCAVVNGDDFGVSSNAMLAVGCGALTNTGSWLRFMCYNLGADTTIDPFIWKSTANNRNDDIKGYLYQWGRVEDGHQLRASGVVAGPYNGDFDANGQIPVTETDFYGKFITRNDGANDWRNLPDVTLWGAAKTASDPCPADWRIPTQAEWGSIFRSGTTSGAPETATSNTWTWNLNSNPGYSICPDGNTVTLYLPAVGRRSYTDGALDLISTGGLYWSNATLGNLSTYLSFGPSGVVPNSSSYRAQGFPVRCVAI